ncbi:class I SAM-dependent methyltransferase [Azonexus sp. IMCC34842]|uniref:class I SAM-dependent methyltransferase n=1 Tax=Azonexus sp. IMCC34842 TaxID=3420950 RepID=UPI003D141C24
MVVLPPGTQLQLMYLRERLRRIQPGRFVEIGPGRGEITALLLELGWSGRSYDLDAKTICALASRFAKEMAAKRFVPVNGDFLSSEVAEQVDLVISCMVMEHLDDNKQAVFMVKAAEFLKLEGVLFSLVPASPGHWGIEDDIAGHCRRYTRAGVEQLVADSGWKLLHVVGLTFPLSNFLLPVSNFLVNRSEGQKLSLSPLERTKQSGRRSVKYKTYFPSMLGLFLNKYTLSPFHCVQKWCARSERALVLFFEAQPLPRGSKQ